MILEKSDNCRYCGSLKMVRWACIDYREQPWHEMQPPGVALPNNELQRSDPTAVVCSGCGLLYDPESMASGI